MSIEQLEDRLVPTVLFTPRFGAENLVANPNGSFFYQPLVSPDVHLIFWGSYWAANSAEVNTLTADAQAIVNSPYTSGMTDYNSAGVAFNGAVYVDSSSDPPQGYDPGNGNAKDVSGNTSYSDLQTEINNVINNPATGIPQPPSDGDAIYTVITAGGTGASYNAPSQYFLPNGFPIPMEMISLSFVPNYTQGAALVFSHELIEAMSSDPIGYLSGRDFGVGVTTPAGLPANIFVGSPAQICDNEPEAYAYRLGGPTGQLVAPYWFNATGSTGAYILGQGNYIVPDGNSEQVTLQPIWNIDSSGNATFAYYNLLIGPIDGTITLNGSYAGWQIDLNGQSFFFDPSTNPIANLTVTLGNGTDTVNVEGTSALTNLVTINLGGGTDTVNVSPTAQALGTIQGNLTINGGAGSDTLNLDDQKSAFNETWTLTSSSVTNLVAATINYFAIDHVNVNGGGGNNTYNVQGTEAFFGTTLNPGGGRDTINVRATSGPLTINTDGLDTVNVGDSRGVQDIQGNLVVNGFFDSPILNLNDAGDPSSRTVTITATAVTGFAPAIIDFNSLSQLNLTGDNSPAGTVFNVQSTPAPLILFGHVLGSTTTTITSNDVDTINVGDHNGVQDIQGNLVIHGAFPLRRLNIDDTADTVKRIATVTNSSVTGLAPASISFDRSSLTQLNIAGGSGGNTFNVQSTAAGTTTSLNAGDGQATDTVNIGSLAPSLGGTLANIAGPVSLSNSSGTTALVLDDSGDATARTATITNNSVTGTWSPGAVNYVGKEVSALTLFGGHAANTFNVQSTSTTTNLVLAGLSTVAVGSGGSTSTLSGIQGALTVNGTGGGNTLKVNDQGDSGGQSFTLSSTVLSRSGGVSITYGAIATLAVSAGTGNDALTLLSPAPTVTTTFDGGGGTNTLTGPNTNNNWTINAANGGTLGLVTFSNVQNLVGGTGVDVFAFTPSGSVSGTINGGGAPLHDGDWLDYSALSTAVTVNLATGSATGVAGGAPGKVSNIQDVHGGNGGGALTGDTQGNILIGGKGTYTIAGGTGASILIADKGAAHITGGSGGDILIGGLTTFDTMTTAHEAALMSILAEWQSSDSYATRFHDIDTGTGGGLNGTNKLNFGTTVKSAGVADTLTAAISSQPLDWFFAGVGDKIINKEKGEHVNNT
jgi:hypothetical protein